MKFNLKRQLVAAFAASIAVANVAPIALIAQEAGYEPKTEAEFSFAESQDWFYNEDGYIQIEAFQLLVPHTNITTSNAVWERSFWTVGSNMGNRMNVFFRNDGNAAATVRVERQAGANWILVSSFSVPAGSSTTRQLQHITLNSSHRVVISGASGANTHGELGIRQVH